MVDCVVTTCRWNNPKGEILLNTPGLAVPQRKLIDLKNIDIDEGWSPKWHWFTGRYVKLYVNDPENPDNNPGAGIYGGYNVYVRNSNTLDRMKWVLSKNEMRDREWYYLSHEKLGYIVDWTDPDNTPQHDPWIALGHQKNNPHLRPFSIRYTDLYAERKEKDRQEHQKAVILAAQKYHQYFPEDSEGIEKCKAYLRYMNMPYTEEEKLKYDHDEYLKKVFAQERAKLRQAHEGWFSYRIRIIKELFLDTYNIVNREYEKKFKLEEQHRKQYEDALENARRKLRIKRKQEQKSEEIKKKNALAEAEKEDDAEEKVEDDDEANLNKEGEGDEENQTNIDKEKENETKLNKEDKEGNETKLNKQDKEGETKEGNETKLNQEGEAKEGNETKLNKEGEAKEENETDLIKEGEAENENETSLSKEGEQALSEEKSDLPIEKPPVDEMDEVITETTKELEQEIKEKEKQLQKLIHQGMDEEEEDEFESKDAPKETEEDDEPIESPGHYGMEPREFAQLLFGLKWLAPSEQMKKSRIQARFQDRNTDSLISAAQAFDILKLFNFSGERAEIIFILFPFLATMEDQLAFARDLEAFLVSKVIYRQVAQDLNLAPLLERLYPSTPNKQVHQYTQYSANFKAPTAQEYLEKYEESFPEIPELPEEFSEPEKKRKAIDVRVPWQTH